MAIRFLQVSDTHLGAKLAGLPDSVAEQLRDSVREILRSAFNEAQASRVDMLLLPGDLFEAGADDPQAELKFIYALAAEAAPLPVIITPGNHDPYGPASPYANLETPANVVLFADSTFSVEEVAGCQVAGRAIPDSAPYGELDLSSLPPPAAAPSLLVLHASVLKAEDGRPHKHMVAKTTAEALRSTGYSYTAIGHYHNFTQFAGRGAKAYAAYAGCPQGLGWDEPGPKGYLFGELNEDGARLNFVPAARHVWHKLKLNLPPAYATDARERLTASLARIEGTIAPGALLALAVAGRWPAASRDALVGRLTELCTIPWHTRELDLTKVEWMPELPGYGISEVLDLFLKRCDTAIAEGGPDQEAWQLTRYLGRRLLAGHGLPEEIAL